MDEAARAQIDSLVASNEITLFMKGTREQPQCGFSATLIRILDTLSPDYHTVDVLADQAIRENIKIYSSWPTIPQLYVKGEFIGGCDIVQELFDTGELARTLGIELPDVGEVGQPKLTITDAAAEQLRAAVEQQGGPDRDLHLGIDARFQSNLFIGPTAEGEFVLDVNGVRLALDRVTASRADGVTIDVTDSPQGSAFKIDNPNAPQVRAMSVEDLKKRLDSGDAIELLDVRTPEERKTAEIAGSQLMTQEQAARLERLPKDTELVFHCHHGGRSQQAAEHFAALGFKKVYNVIGGIDAWSQQIDPSVPRY